MLAQLRFAGAPVLVTGAAAGIGRACCDVLAELGATLLLADRDAAVLQQAATALRSSGAAVRTYHVDVAKEAEVLALHRAIAAEWDHLKALLNIAGTNYHCPIAELPTEKWHEIVAINLDSMFYTCRAFIPMLKQAPSGGAIVNMASSLGFIGLPGMPVYCATKGAVMALTRQLAVDYGGDNIRVNAVCPGVALSPRLRGYLESGRNDIEALKQLASLGRFASCEEIANVVVFLASDAASYMHGASVVIDAGQTIG